MVRDLAADVLAAEDVPKDAVTTIGVRPVDGVGGVLDRTQSVRLRALLKAARDRRDQ